MSHAGKWDRNEWTLLWRDCWRGYWRDGSPIRSCICMWQTSIIGADDRTVPQAAKDCVIPKFQSKAKVENKIEKGSLVVENNANNQ